MADEAEAFFRGNPAQLGLFRAVRAFTESLGGVTLRVTKTQIAFQARRQFAWVWLPQRIVRGPPEDSITLAFGLQRRVDDPRIKDVAEPQRGRWTHHVILTEGQDFDSTVQAWMREAYALAGQSRGRNAGPL